MHNYIPAPAAGDPLRASWARDVTAVCNSVAAASAPGSLVRDGAGAFGHEQMPANMRDRAVGRTYPFRFSRATISGADAWIVYLSASSLIIDGTAVNVAAGLSAAGAPYAAGWYVSGIPFAPGDTTVYLSIAYNITSSGSTYSGVSLRTSPQTDTSAMHFVNIVIAYLHYTATPSSATIHQNIIGAIALSSGGGGGSVTPDDVSIDVRDSSDYTADGKLQIKDFDHASPPAANTNLADDLLNGSSTDLIICRTANKQLVYKGIGDLADPSGTVKAITKTVECFTNPKYSTSTRECTANKVTLVFVKGLLTSATVDQTATVIFTATPHSAEHS